MKEEAAEEEGRVSHSAGDGGVDIAVPRRLRAATRGLSPYDTCLDTERSSFAGHLERPIRPQVAKTAITLGPTGIPASGGSLPPGDRSAPSGWRRAGTSP